MELHDMKTKKKALRLDRRLEASHDVLPVLDLAVPRDTCGARAARAGEGFGSRGSSGGMIDEAAPADLSPLRREERRARREVPALPGAAPVPAAPRGGPAVGRRPAVSGPGGKKSGPALARPAVPVTGWLPTD